MIVRPAAPGDAAGIAALVNPVIRDTAITFTTEEKTPRSISRAIRDTGAYFVAGDGPEIAGYACYFQFRGGPGYAHAMEHSITLAPEARGRGIGRGLMHVLETHAKAQGAHVMVAGVSGENAGGIAFHSAIGYREVGRMSEVGRKFDRWLDLVLMQKLL